MVDNYDVIVIGLNVVDILFELPNDVQYGEKHSINKLVIQGGAPAGNAACGLSKLGWNIGFLGKVGNNLLSNISITELKSNGISDDLLIESDNAQPAVAIVAIDPKNGERTVYYSLNNYKYLKEIDVPKDKIKNAKAILVDGYEIEASLEALKIAKKYNKRSILDIESGDKDLMKRAMKLGTDTILPFTCAKELTGLRNIDDILLELSRWTEGLVLVTDGINGSWGIENSSIFYQEAFKVNAVDTTGCGDAYHAGYTSALLDNLDLKLRMEFASYFASRVALQFGGRTNLPTRDFLRLQDLSILSSELQEYIRG